MLQFVLNVKKPKNRVILAILTLIFLSVIHACLSLNLPVYTNRGVSFGLYFSGIEWIILATLVLILFFLIKRFSWGLYLVWCGGVINLVNRIVVGHVFDYFNLGFVSNNIADFMIFIGIMLFLFRNDYRD